MYTFAAAEAPFAQDLWAYAVASAALDDALHELAAAIAALEVLVDMTNWQVQAGRVLNPALEELRSGARGQATVLRDHRELLDRVVWW